MLIDEPISIIKLRTSINSSATWVWILGLKKLPRKSKFHLSSKSMRPSYDRDKNQSFLYSAFLTKQYVSYSRWVFSIIKVNYEWLSDHKQMPVKSFHWYVPQSMEVLHRTVAFALELNPFWTTPNYFTRSRLAPLDTCLPPQFPIIKWIIKQCKKHLTLLSTIFHCSFF